MKKTMIFSMLFVLAILLCPASLVFAEDVPGDDMPELFDSTAQVTTFDIGAVNLDDEPAPAPDPDPEPCE